MVCRPRPNAPCPTAQTIGRVTLKLPSGAPGLLSSPCSTAAASLVPATTTAAECKTQSRTVTSRKIGVFPGSATSPGLRLYPRVLRDSTGYPVTEICDNQPSSITAMITLLRPRPHVFRHVRSSLLAAHVRHNPTREVCDGNLIYEERGGARIFTLNRPKQLNAISGEMFHSLIDTIGVSYLHRAELTQGMGQGPRRQGRARAGRRPRVRFRWRHQVRRTLHLFHEGLGEEDRRELPLRLPDGQLGGRASRGALRLVYGRYHE